jgi:hypothetical protein
MSEKFKFAEPVTHEFGAFFLYTELDLYNSVINYFMNSVDDPYNHYINLSTRRFKFFSKPGGLKNPKTGQIAFEYILTWKDAFGASKCTFTIKPLFGAGTKTKTGKTLNLPTVGTQIQVQSSYIELDELLTLFESFMDQIDAARFVYSLDRNNSKIYQMARHVRYHESYENTVAGMLQKIEQESSTLGDVNLTKQMDSGKYYMYYLSNPDFKVCNINTKFNHSVKTYRIKNYKERTSADPLRHPKLEVFLHSDDTTPSINQYLELKRDLDDLLIKLLSFVQPIEYVTDEYFDGERVFEYRNKLPIWDYENLPNPDIDGFDLWHHPEKTLSVLAYIATQSEGCTEFRQISEALTIPIRSLWRYINHWKCEGVLDTKRKECTYVFFKSKSLWQSIKEPILQVCSFLKINFKRVWGQTFIDSGVIRNFRERRKKNLKPHKVTGDDKRELVVVDDARKANALRKELREEGVSHLFKIGIASTKSNMRYSRVIN